MSSAALPCSFAEYARIVGHGATMSGLEPPVAQALSDIITAAIKISLCHRIGHLLAAHRGIQLGHDPANIMILLARLPRLEPSHRGIGERRDEKT